MNADSPREAARRKQEQLVIETLEDAVSPMLVLKPVGIRVSLSIFLDLSANARTILGLLVTADPYLHANEYSLIFTLPKERA